MRSMKLFYILEVAAEPGTHLVIGHRKQDQPLCDKTENVDESQHGATLYDIYDI